MPPAAAAYKSLSLFVASCCSGHSWVQLDIGNVALMQKSATPCSRAAVVQLYSLLMMLAQMLCMLPYTPMASGPANNALLKAI